MAVCGGDGAATATEWGKWNMDSEGRRLGLGKPGIRAGGKVEGLIAPDGTVPGMKDLTLRHRQGA